MSYDDVVAPDVTVSAPVGASPPPAPPVAAPAAAACPPASGDSGGDGDRRPRGIGVRRPMVGLTGYCTNPPAPRGLGWLGGLNDCLEEQGQKKSAEKEVEWSLFPSVGCHLD